MCRLFKSLIKAACGVILFAGIIFYSCPAWANITIKVLGVNPSKTQEQNVTLKAYLPKEVTPSDILSRSDLEMTYDTQQGAYFVFGDYMLEPEGSIEKEIVIKDIWVIPNAEIENLRTEIDKTIELIKNTEFEERAKFLKESIETKLERIVGRQSASAANPQAHISEYRDNLDLLEAAKQDLILARSFLSQAKRLPSITIWKVFFYVIAFLGILAASLYFVLVNQSKTLKENLEVLGAVSKEEEPAPEQHTAQEKKKVSAADIEDMMKEKKE